MYWEFGRQVFIAEFFFLFKTRSRLIFTQTMIKPGLLHIVDAQDARTTLFSAHHHPQTFSNRSSNDPGKCQD